MSDVEYELVRWRVKDIMEPYNKFYSTKAWTEMSRIDRTTLNHIMADLTAQNSKLFDAQVFDVGR